MSTNVALDSYYNLRLPTVKHEHESSSSFSIFNIEALDVFHQT